MSCRVQDIVSVRCLSVVVLAGTLVLASGLSSKTFAVPMLLGPSPYLSFDDSPFNGETFAVFELEDFEDGVFNAPGVSSTIVGTVRGPSSSTDSVDQDDGTIDGSGTGGHSLFSGGATRLLTFVFDEAVLGGLPTHAGVVWTDVEDAEPDPGMGNVIFEAFDVSGVSLGFIEEILGDGNGFGGTAEDRFIGVIHSSGVSRIDIRVGNSTDWEVDHLQYGIISSSTPIPEPSSVVLLSSGLLVLVAWRRKAQLWS